MALRPRPTTVEDLYGGGHNGELLDGRYDTKAVHAWFQKRHRASNQFIDEDGYYRRNDHEWKVPYGVRVAARTPLKWCQIASKYPFLVTWRSPTSGKRCFKRMMSLPHAIVFVAERAQYVDSHATIINRIGMDIPAKLRNKIPKPWKWCPRCMKARKYKRVYRRSGDAETFYGPIKVWNEDKARYEMQDRRLALMCCPVCGGTNRDSTFRRSNQPFETVRVKRGRTRMKRRRR